MSVPSLPLLLANQGSNRSPVPHAPTSSNYRRTELSHSPALPSSSSGTGAPKMEPPLVFSFDVLRSDPASSSLEHIASSATLPNRGNNPSGQSSQAGIANGSAPAFRVSVPSSPSPMIDMIQPTHRSNKHLMSSGPESTQMRSSKVRQSHPPSTPHYSAIISFPVSDTMGRSSDGLRDLSPDELVHASEDDEAPGGNTGKKHICPTCLKRFNRPSSLRIHVNTHTGATRMSTT